jgi:uncharacterized protein (TIGR03437 family)
MTERGNRIAKIAVAAVALPLLLLAYVTGPDPGYSGVPGEHGGQTCANASCHGGTANSFSGSVKVTFPNGLSYVPGVKQRLVVSIADPAATQRLWGYQMTARRAADESSAAGILASPDTFSLVLCSLSSNLNLQTELNTGGACPDARPLQYIEHSFNGASRQAAGGMEYQVDWTPPATNAGDVVFYVAGNAANGNGTNAGDHIYTARYTLTPSAGGGPTPTITAVEHGASFAPGIAPNAFIQIKGTNLANTTDLWNNAIVAGKLPTTLDNVSVSVGGKPAYVYFVSPGQINVLTPPDTGTGSMQVTVTNSGAASAGFATSANSLAPAFFLWDGKYAVATDNATGRFAVKSSVFPTLNAAPAKPGDVIVLWGTGFGATNPATPAGTQVPAGQFNTATPVTVTVGNAPATVFYAILSSGFAGLYQVAIQIPANAPDGDLPVVATVSGAASPATTLLTVQR